MKQIGEPFKDYYYIDEKGIFSKYQKKYLKPPYKLLTLDNVRKSVSFEDLYYKVFNKRYCYDNIKDLENEQWKEIEPDIYEGRYFISNLGRVKSYSGNNAKLLPIREGKYKKSVHLEYPKEFRKSFDISYLLLKYFNTTSS